MDGTNTHEHEHGPPDAVIQKLLDWSTMTLGAGANPAHHQVYQEAVREIGTWPINPDTVTQLRELYANSWQVQRDTHEPCQPTYRRALVHVLAARLSATASEEARRPIVISPAQARPVLESIDSGLRVDHDYVIIAAIARSTDPDDESDQER